MFDIYIYEQLLKKIKIKFKTINYLLKKHLNESKIEK